MLTHSDLTVEVLGGQRCFIIILFCFFFQPGSIMRLCLNTVRPILLQFLLLIDPVTVSHAALIQAKQEWILFPLSLKVKDMTGLKSTSS